MRRINIYIDDDLDERAQREARIHEAVSNLRDHRDQRLLVTNHVPR